MFSVRSKAEDKMQTKKLDCVDIGKFAEYALLMALSNLILPQHVGPVCSMFAELHASPPSRQAVVMHKGSAALNCHVCISLSLLFSC